MSDKTLLHRDDPSKEPLTGHVKVTREDWVNAAREALIRSGVGDVKILTLSAQLDVSRSSFYWYFKDRDTLLEALLEDWETRNTKTIVEHCSLPAPSIHAAVCNFFRCFVNPALFDQGLDFAVREWARRDGAVRRRIDRADQTRLQSVAQMFERFGYPEQEADTRGRILYFMQLGYHALDVREPMAERMRRTTDYLQGFTGRAPEAATAKAFSAYAMSFETEL